MVSKKIAKKHLSLAAEFFKVLAAKLVEFFHAEQRHVGRPLKAWRGWLDTGGAVVFFRPSNWGRGHMRCLCLVFFVEKDVEEVFVVLVPASWNFSTVAWSAWLFRRFLV